MNDIFKINDKVLSSSKYSNNYIGVVWKISDKAVHVKFEANDFQKFGFQKFYFNSTHHMQTPIEQLKLIS